MRETLAGDLDTLADRVKAIREPSRYPVEFSPKLTALREEIAKKNA
jgi:hypothetical protein